MNMIIIWWGIYRRFCWDDRLKLAIVFSTRQRPVVECQNTGEFIGLRFLNPQSYGDRQGMRSTGWFWGVFQEIADLQTFCIFHKKTPHHYSFIWHQTFRRWINCLHKPQWAKPKKIHKHTPGNYTHHQCMSLATWRYNPECHAWLRFISALCASKIHKHFFYRQLDFSSEPGVANEILEKDAKSCLTVA